MPPHTIPTAVRPTPFHLKAPATQAGILCNGLKFQRWLAATHPAAWAAAPGDTTAAKAAAVVRQLCAVTSRRDLNAAPGRDAWRGLLNAWVDYDLGRI